MYHQLDSVAFEWAARLAFANDVDGSIVATACSGLEEHYENQTSMTVLSQPDQSTD